MVLVPIWWPISVTLKYNTPAVVTASTLYSLNKYKVYNKIKEFNQMSKDKGIKNYICLLKERSRVN